MALLSQKSIEANRRNATHSTGPRTREGKNRSRANATTHGLAAITTIYRPLRHENPDDFIELRAKLVTEFNPATTAEHLAIEMAAAAYKRIQRVEAMEVAFCDGAMAAIQLRNGREPHRTQNDDLGAALTAGQKSNKLTWETLDRWRRSAWLDYNRSIAQLTKLQKERVESELRLLRLHKQHHDYLRRTHVPTQRAEQPTSSASFREAASNRAASRHREIARRLLGPNWRKNGLQRPARPQNPPAEPRQPAPERGAKEE